MKSRLNVSANGFRKRSKSLGDIENVSLRDFKTRNGGDEEDYRRLLSDILYKIKTGDLEAVLGYADDGFDMTYCDYDKRTPLHIAAAEGQANIVNFLLDYCNVDPNALDRWNFTPHDEAKRFGHVHITKQLAEIMGTQDIGQQDVGTDEYDETIPKHCIQSVEEETSARLLYRVKEGNIAAVKRFQRDGIDMCVYDYDDRTALHIAAAEGHEAVVSFLIEQCRADLNSKDRWENRPVDEARRFKHTDVVALLEGYTARTGIGNTSDMHKPLECHCDQDQTNVGIELTELDSSTIAMYTDALESGSEKSSFTRVSIIGPPNVGKTSLARNLQEQSLEGIHSTDGISVCKVAYSEDLNITENPVGTREGAVRIYNAQSVQQANETSVSNMSLNGEKAGEFDAKNLHDRAHYDLTNNEKVQFTFSDEDLESSDLENNSLATNSLRRSTNSLRLNDLQEETEQEEIPLLTKTCSDSAMNNMVAFQDVMQSNKPPCKFNTMNIWDYGGQCEYYSIHQLFLSSMAVYIFVFDISKAPSDDIQDHSCQKQKSNCGPTNAKAYFKCWINSVHTFAGCKKGYPKVILVGTHKDKLTGCEEDKHKEVEDRFDQMRELFDGSELQCHVDSEDFVIDNTNPNREDVHRLKQRIQYLQKEYEAPRMPVKWIPLEIALRNLPQKCVTLNEISNIDKDSKVPINNTEEIRAFLKVHHMLGNLVYFDDGEISDFVILDPQWIIDAFTRLVTAEKRYRKIPELRSALKSLREKAILQDNVIQSTWNEEDNRFLDYKEMLLKILIKLHILVKPLWIDVDSCKVKEGDFIVPSLLQRFDRNQITSNSLLRAELSTIPLSYEFNNSFIAQTFFHRILAALISELPIYRGNVYANLKTITLEL